MISPPPRSLTMTWIKICGLTNLEDALAAVSLGADALGFIFAPSPRRTDPARAAEIIHELPPVQKVGVFVDERVEEVQRIAEECGLDALQLHGRESPEQCRRFSLPVIKAISVRSKESLQEAENYPLASILLDAAGMAWAGGSGRVFPWEWARRVRRDFILSGGLNPGNVGEAIRLLRPRGVDVGSGVERAPGKKDRRKMAEFIKEVKRADGATG